jgi:potassium channel LctB
LVFYFLLLFVTFCIFMSLRILFIPNKIKGKVVSLENFLLLILIYVTTVIGFGVIYVLFELKGATILLDSGEVLTGDFFLKLESSLYFSAMTLFSVGHGDVVPLGVGRMIALLEALIGYTIPAAFVARAVRDMEH